MNEARDSLIRASTAEDVADGTWYADSDILEARRQVSRVSEDGSISWAIFGYDLETCEECTEVNVEDRLCEHALTHPRLVATGSGGMDAFVEVNGENQLTKEMKSLGYLYWVYARVNLKDRERNSVNRKKRLSRFQNVVKESVLGSKKLLLMSYKTAPSKAKLATFTEEEKEKLSEINYSMNIRLHSHGWAVRKLFHHHVFVQAMPRNKIFHRNLYPKLMSVVSVEGDSLVVVLKVKQEINTDETREARLTSFVEELGDDDFVYLPLVMYAKTTDTVLKLKEEVVENMQKRGLIWNVDDMKVSVMKNKSNAAVLRTLKGKTATKPRNRLKVERSSFVSRTSSLPAVNSLVSFKKLTEDNQTLAEIGLLSGDEVLVEKLERRKASAEQLEKVERQESVPVLPVPFHRPKFKFGAQALLKKRKELDLFTSARTLEHNDLLKMTSKRKKSSVKKQSQQNLRQRQSILRKKKLIQMVQELGANFIETSNILVTKEKPLGVGRTARVYEGLLKCHVGEGNLQKSMMMVPSDVDRAFEAKNERLTLKSDNKGQIRSFINRLNPKRLRRPRKKKTQRMSASKLPSTALDDAMTLEPLEVAVKVAIKRFTARLVTEAVALAFQQEVQALCRVDHPGIVRCLGVYVDDGNKEGEIDQSEDLQLLIVYELCTRGDLRDLKKQSTWPGVSFSTRFDMILPAAKALSAIHEIGIVHRDIKPDNILVSETFTLKIGDFGVAKVLNTPTAGDDKVGGTLGYTAPEVVSESCAGTSESDIFSFGVVLFELMSDFGKVGKDEEYTPKSSPFATNVTNYVSQFEGNKHLDSLEFHPDLPDSFVKIVKQSLREDPGERCTAKEIAEVIEELTI